MLKEMRASMFDDDESGETGLGSGPLAETLFSELSLALSRTGGLGLADSVLAPLARQAGAPEGAAGELPLALPSPALPPVPLGLQPTALPALDGRVSSGYGWRQDPIDGSPRFHHGVDFALPEGHDVPAARRGRVTFVGEQSGYGLTVIVEHAGGMATRYAHLSRAVVSAGDEVEAGQVIAHSGATGKATGPHLHVEVIEAGKRVNPAAILRTYGQAGVTER
jgi:murein DD-endopeptidase MepM/ murein hydrolase activator NlpD